MRRFIECLLPSSICNLKCSYCYLIQQDRRKNKKAEFQYPPKIIAKALSVSRLGGVSLISITGEGETLVANELPQIVSEILKQGHFVNITTNGTLSKQLDRILEETEGYHSKLHFSFSFHYVELLKKKLVDTFFDNIQKVKKSGCSILLQINLADEYVPYWEEIKRISKEKCGALPQVALTREQSNGSFKIMTKTMSDEEYIQKGKEMNSPLFDFTCKNFMVKRNEYCYAGFWSATLNLCTGEMTGCYGNGIKQNIFKNIEKPIKWMPIGKHCCAKYCFNSSHFMSQGIIPELLPLPSYGALRNRDSADWYTEDAKQFLYSQFEKSNNLISKSKQLLYNCQFYTSKLQKFIHRICIKFHGFCSC